MHLVRSPLRLSLGGGGTDLPSYYRKRGGYLIAAAINKYVYTSIIKPFSNGIYLKYSELEKVKTPEEIKHNIFREVLSMDESINNEGRIEITTLADIPYGTGLGSSGAFTVSLIKALSLWNNDGKSNMKIAEEACHVEIDRLQEPVGKQDQFISAIGGIQEFYFNKDDSVEVKPLNIPTDCMRSFKESCLIFYTGKSRSASKILLEQDKKSKENSTDMIYNLDQTKDLGFTTRNLLLNGDIMQYGLLLKDHWNNKLKRSPSMCSEELKESYEIALNNGALGGKLIGAGGGGFFMFISNDRDQLRDVMLKKGYTELDFQFDYLGVHTLISD